MKPQFESTLRWLLGQAGYAPRKRGFPMRTYGECFGAMRARGLAPATVFDVGVAQGTPQLYRSFPQAHHVLIDPLIDSVPLLPEIRRKYRVTMIAAAAGERPGSALLEVGVDPRKSSLARKVLRGNTRDRKEVPVVTLSDVCRESGLAPPFLIKADVEGAELGVIAGARDVLGATQAIVLETSFWDSDNQVPELCDVVVAMKEHGFVAYDIIGAALHSVNGGLGHVDLVFVRADGPFRSRSRPAGGAG